MRQLRRALYILAYFITILLTVFEIVVRLLLKPINFIFNGKRIDELEPPIALNVFKKIEKILKR